VSDWGTALVAVLWLAHNLAVRNGADLHHASPDQGQFLGLYFQSEQIAGNYFSTLDGVEFFGRLNFLQREWRNSLMRTRSQR